METLGEDLVLLAMTHEGKVGVADKLRFGVAGSELVRLAAAQRVDVVDGRIVVLSRSRTGDARLDAALADIERSKRPPKAGAWVARDRPGLVESYLEQLVSQGVVRAERRKRFGIFTVTRWFVIDSGRVAQARDRLDAVARSSGPIDSSQAALGGLAHAIELDVLLYPLHEGPANESARERLEQIAEADPAAATVRSTAEQAAVDASIDAAMAASVNAAVSASVYATHHAAVQHGGHDGGAGAVGGHH